jgi:hypothetical protein
VAYIKKYITVRGSATNITKYGKIRRRKLKNLLNSTFQISVFEHKTVAGFSACVDFTDIFNTWKG